MADVSERSDLRLNVLNVEEENFGDGNFVALHDFIGDKIPSGFGYSIRVCVLGNETDYCRMEAPVFIATIDEEIYVEEIIVSAELGGGADAMYSPKKLRLFVWEGESFEEDCNNTCSPAGPVFSCSADFTQVLKRTCGNFDDDFCLEWEGEAEVFKTCGEGKECVGLGICEEVSNYFNLTCEKRVFTYMGCVDDSQDATICAGYDGKQETGGCDCHWFFGCDGDYTNCWNDETMVTECSDDPNIECPEGYSEVGRERCVLPTCEDTSWTPSPSDRCVGETFTQISNCGTTRSAVGTKNCVAELRASYVMSGSGNMGATTHFSYISTISETGGNVGATINSGQKCYYWKESGVPKQECDDEKYAIALYYGTDYIAPGGQISDSPSAPNFVDLINGYSYTVTETFKGTDDNGNSVQTSYSFSVTA